jgi:hypothetical protein
MLPKRSSSGTGDRDRATRAERGIALTLASAALILAAAPDVALAETLWDRVQSHRVDEGYADLPVQHRLELLDLYRSLVAWAPLGAVPDDAEARASSLGLRLERSGDLLLVLPARAVAKGHGLCALRLGPGQGELILQAPHAWSDLHSGAITAALFEAGTGRAACFNTAHRRTASEGDLMGASPWLGADLAHRPASGFQAATLGLVSGLHDPLIVQVHGFGSGHGSFSAVISDGASFQPARLVQRAMTALDPSFSAYGLLADGAMVPQLAATTNAQSRATATDARFLHLELSLPLREHLLTSETARDQLGETLNGLVEPAP